MSMNNGTNEQHALSLSHLPHAGGQPLQCEITHKAQHSYTPRGEQAAQAIRPLSVSNHTLSSSANAQKPSWTPSSSKMIEAQPDQPSTLYREGVTTRS